MDKEGEILAQSTDREMPCSEVVGILWSRSTNRIACNDRLCDASARRARGMPRRA